MIPDANRTQVLQAVAPAKAAEKVQNTRLGMWFVGGGFASAALSFALMARMVWTDADISLLGLILTCVPAGFGLILCVYGAHQWSSEYVTAATKDILSLFGGISKLWKRNGK